jgi:hypothetical protein
MTIQSESLNQYIDQIEQHEIDIYELDFNDDDILPWANWAFLSEGQKRALKEMYSSELADHVI